jgi:hypothetical protein
MHDCYFFDSVSVPCPQWNILLWNEIWRQESIEFQTDNNQFYSLWHLFPTTGTTLEDSSCCTSSVDFNKKGNFWVSCIWGLGTGHQKLPCTDGKVNNHKVRWFIMWFKSIPKQTNQQKLELTVQVMQDRGGGVCSSQAFVPPPQPVLGKVKAQWTHNPWPGIRPTALVT